MKIPGSRVRREERINAQVTDAAMLAAVDIRDSLEDEEVGPYRIPLGRIPRGIPASEYAERLGNTIEVMLGAIGCEDQVAFDRYISSYTSRSQSGHRLPFLHGSVEASPWIVFTHVADKQADCIDRAL